MDSERRISTGRISIGRETAVLAARLLPAASLYACAVLASVPAVADEPPVKLSRSGICHERGAPFYAKTTHFQPYATLDACLRAGGRLPHGVQPLSEPGAPPPSAANAESELSALGEAWIAAEVRHDRAALEALLDERFHATTASGRTLDRAAFIDSILKMPVEPFTVTNDVIEIHGDTALVIATIPGGNTKFTWIAVKKAGRWRVISETLSRMQAVSQ